jgi:hypothetical protein
MSDVVKTFENETIRIEVIFDEGCSIYDNPLEYSGVEYHLDGGRYFHMKSEGFEKKNPDYWYFPVFAYIHSGYCFSLSPFSCRWDSGCCGYFAVKRPSRGGEWKTQKAALKYLTALIKDLNRHVLGDYYGIKVSELVNGEWQEVDACWGYLGLDYAETEAESQFNWWVANTPKQLSLV